MFQKNRLTASGGIDVADRRERPTSMSIRLTSHRVMAYILFVLSLVLHLGWLSYPKEVVFDEVHYGKYVFGYLTGEYFFNVHPPLAKLMIAGVARLVGVAPTYDFAEIGAPYPDHQFIWLRLLPALFGSLLVPLVYLVALRSTRSHAAAALAGVFVLLDNALLVQSKFIFLDAFWLVFGFLSLYLFLESTLFFADGRWGQWAAFGAAVAAGLCIASKWTGVGFWGLLLLARGYSAGRKIWKGGPGRQGALIAYAALLVVPLALYSVVFFVHFTLLPKPGPGNGFMTPRFQASQAAGYPLRDFPANLWEENRRMYASHMQFTAAHPFESHWYEWPLMLRPIYYWSKDVRTNSRERTYKRIYLLGNPFVWWVSTGLTAVFLSVLVLRLVLQASRWLFPRQCESAGADAAQRIGFVDVFLAVGYVANLLPFALGSRITYLYYYLASLIFSILIASVILGRIYRGKTAVYVALAVLALIGFLIVLPVTFGIRLNDWPLWHSDIVSQ